MYLRVLGSSSQGNCYIIGNDSEAIVLEAGVHFREVKRALDYNLRKVAACLITHRHGDHAAYAKDFVNSGLYTLAPADVWESKDIVSPRAKVVTAGRGYKVGRFQVYAFEAYHDVPCLGYHIKHPEIGNLLFLTDSTDCTQIFPNLNHILIECNYSLPRLMQAIAEGRTPPHQLERLQHAHLDLETCKHILANQDLTQVQSIILLHLSNHNSDHLRFVEEIERQTGRATYAAKAGLTIGLNLGY